MHPTSNDSSNLNLVWHSMDVARAQHALVTLQLRAGNATPFLAFTEAMEALLEQRASSPKGLAMLEVGCGVGHYGVLVQRRFPNVSYHGTDASAAMIMNTLLPRDQVQQLDFYDNDFSKPDLVMVSQVLEVLEGPELALRHLLINLHAGAVLLFHRIRWVEQPSEQLIEPTYLGLPSRNFIWNGEALLALLQEYGTLLYMERWDQGVTLLLQRGAK